MYNITHQSIFKGEYADVASVVYVVATHDRIGVVLDPYASERIAGDLIVLVGALCVVRYVQTDVLTVADVTVFDHWVSAGAAHANCGAHCNTKIVNGQFL